MKKVVVVGLGIIGGSIAAKLSQQGHFVAGKDINTQNVFYALEKGYVCEIATNLAEYDVVFIATPPSAAMRILQTETFKDGAFVADICGVKSCIEQAVYQAPRNYRYVGLHPMAGKETSGIASATSVLFEKANIILCQSDFTPKADIDEACQWIQELGFGKTVICSAKEHDQKIALTSQLAHIVSNAYVKSPQVQGYEGFTGGSFQDMTRIAGVDEDIWTSLYFFNREYVLDELNCLIEHLQEYQTALQTSNEAQLKELLKAGRLIREKIRTKKE